MFPYSKMKWKPLCFFPSIVYKNQIYLNQQIFPTPHFHVQSFTENESIITLNGIHSATLSPQTRIYEKERHRLLYTVQWNDTTVESNMVQNDLYRINRYGIITHIDFLHQKNSHFSLPLEKNDFVTCCSYHHESNMTFITTFYNHFYILQNQTKIFKFMNLASFETFRYPNKIRCFSESQWGPITVVIEFQEGYYLYFKVVIYKQIEMIDKSILKISAQKHKILDYKVMNFNSVLFLSDRWQHHPSKQKCLFLFNTKSSKIQYRYIKPFYQQLWSHEDKMYVWNPKTFQWTEFNQSNLSTSES